MKNHIKKEGKYLISVDSEAKQLILVGGEIPVEDLEEIAKDYCGYTFFYKNYESKIQKFKPIPENYFTNEPEDFKPFKVLPYLKWETNTTL